MLLVLPQMDADARGWTGQYNAKAAQGTMLKRPGRAEEVAAAIPFLASDDASCVTGALQRPPDVPGWAPSVIEARRTKPTPN
jgi:NAD(P)-dependent dehydrogenase (short-subunit alcohol dehydrogenase family)